MQHLSIDSLIPVGSERSFSNQAWSHTFLINPWLTHLSSQSMNLRKWRIDGSMLSPTWYLPWLNQQVETSVAHYKMVWWATRAYDPYDIVQLTLEICQHPKVLHQHLHAPARRLQMIPQGHHQLQAPCNCLAQTCRWICVTIDYGTVVDPWYKHTLDMSRYTCMEHMAKVIQFKDLASKDYISMWVLYPLLHPLIRLTY